MGNTFKKDPNKKRAEAAAATKDLNARSDSDDRWSEVAPAEDPDLPPDIHQAFAQAWRIRADAIGTSAMTAEDVRGVFAKAFELGDWGYEKTVPLEEVSKTMQETLGLKNKKKVQGEEAFFAMFKKIALSGDGFVDNSLVEEEPTPTSAAEAPAAAPAFPESSGTAPKVKGSTVFVFTDKAKSKPVKGDNPCLLWSEDWKKKHVEGNKQYMLPGKGFAFQNDSEKHLRFELDFVDSENYAIVEPQLKHVTRQGTRIMKIVPPGECHFVATIAQKEPGFALTVGLQMKVVEVIGETRQVYQ
eukprot:CAMPEP_0205909866 /NCGR_PEP_ID=MMETSP1325-20131115/4130_1 /ASSEMBLY_ACC=CAM_ASM_000708 /TAXON_ID=236786 /ORGANISM="Florenciella sp., Strain RCC1007" /LENGTH=299 /DNA_ID=CAMNT_0053276191 /DNA_START=33 /DNA_END=932 /DNA_ORIENTATION=+